MAAPEFAAPPPPQRVARRGEEPPRRLRGRPRLPALLHRLLEVLLRLACEMGVPLLAPAAHLPETAVVVPIEHRIDASEGRELPSQLVCRQLGGVSLHLKPQEGR